MGLAASDLNAVDVFVKICESSNRSDFDLQESVQSNLHVLNACSSRGKLALISALDAGNVNAVEWILSDSYDNLRINNCDGEGRTALMAACSTPDPELGLNALQIMICKWGKTIKYAEQDEINRWSALHYCAYHDYSDHATMLIQAFREYTPESSHGLASLLDYYGQSALHIASSRGHIATLRVLLKTCYSSSDVSLSSMNIRSRDFEGFSAIDVADNCQDGTVTVEDVRDILLAHEAKISTAGEC